MTTKLRPWGNSYGLLITKEEVKRMNIHSGSPVEKIFTDIGLWCRPIPKGGKKLPTLKEMIASIPKDGGHKLLFKGPPVGREVW